MARPVAVLLLMPCGPALIGCTAGDQRPPTAASYLAGGNEICRAAIADISELDFRSSQSDEEREQAAIDLGVLHRDASRALLGLQPPPDLEADHAELVALYDHFDDAVQSLEPMREIQERGQAFDDAVADIGFEDCG